jgi:hypothetical protein
LISTGRRLLAPSFLAAESQFWRSSLYAPSTSAWLTPVLHTMIASPINGVCSTINDRQSMLMTFQALPNNDEIWSRIPHFTPTNSFSAARHSFAKCIRSASGSGGSSPFSFRRGGTVAGRRQAEGMEFPDGERRGDPSATELLMPAPGGIVP